MPKTNTCILVVLLLLSSVQSYCGTLKGSVNDKQTGEPIIGGVVVLHGTSYGTTTGLDGSYEIKNIPAGEYDLEMMYTSFTTFHQHIVVKDAETLTVNEANNRRAHRGRGEGKSKERQR